MYDIAIIGGGPAGLNAALYAGRGGMKTLLIEKLFCGGQVITAYEVDNYIGFPKPTSGAELISNMEAHARRFGVKIVSDNVTGLSIEGTTKEIVCENQTFHCKAIIICTGASPRTLGLQHEEELRGRGVSYCATCDGAFFRNKRVAVVGGGDTAVEDALFLSRFCSHVYLIHRRDSFRAAKTIVDKIVNNEKIQLVLDSVVTSIYGEQNVSSINIKNTKTDEISLLDVNALFVAVGTVPANQLFLDILPIDESGYIITDDNMNTSIPGVYAAGDIRHKSFRQIITAAADGAIAANSAINYILHND